MSRAIRVVLGLALGLGCLEAGQSDVIEDLLRIPAPLPGPKLKLEMPQNKTQTAPPGDDAPLDVLARYWAQRWDRDSALPSDLLRQRLLEACEADPEYLPSLLSIVPDSPSVHDRIKALLDHEQRSPRFSADWQRTVTRYLMLHSRYFRQDLIKAAQGAHDEGSTPRGAEELAALAGLDWDAAEPILTKLAASENERVGSAALALLYRHYTEAGSEAKAGGFRDRLKRIVENKSAAGRARDTAAEVLLTTRWDGRDAWYLSLFRDPTLRELHDDYLMMTPLSHIDMDTDRWISILTELVGDSNRAVHDAAVSCLVGFQLQNARRSALLPLLPWLMDPKWSAARDRLRLIQSMDRVEMPEAVPGLIAVLDQESEYDRSYAAESLARYKDPRAVPALKRALDRETDWAHRMRIIHGLVACGGVGDDDAVRSLEALATQNATEKGSAELDAASYDRDAGRRIPPAVMVGLYLAKSEPPGNAVVRRLLDRAKSLQAEQPSVASALLRILDAWPVRAIDEDLVQRIVNSKADASTIYSALRRRASLRQTVATELANAADGVGHVAGIAAVLLGDQKHIAAILEGSDGPAQRALIACARLAGEPLAVPEVARLLERNDPSVAAAAEAYLVAEDSEIARRLVLLRHRGEAVILGARQEYDPGHNTYPEFDQLERHLREEAREGVENYALLSAGYWGSNGQIILRIQKDSAELMYVTDPARYHARSVSHEELAKLREFVASSGIERLGPLATGVADGMQYEYVHVSSAGGRRVFMNNPGISGTGGSAYDMTCDYFRRLLDSGKMELKYPMEKRVPGFEVLLASESASVLSVWKQGEDTRLLIQRDAGGQSSGVAVVEGNTAQVNVSRSDSQRPEWVSYSGGRIPSAVSAPPDFGPVDLKENAPPKFEIEEGRHTASWSLSLGENTYRIGTWNGKQGLWKLANKRNPALMLEGNCALPIVTPDGRWAVVAKTDGTWAEPNYVVRVDLMNGRPYRVNVSAADTFNPVAYVPAHKRVLLVRKRDDETGSGRIPVGPEKAEFLLLDPATGGSNVVTGEFTPFLHQGTRPLQSTGKEDEVWAALPDSGVRSTTVGRYDTKGFVFHPVLSLPSLLFSSAELWIDEHESKIYIAYNGHLLRVSLP